MRKPDFSDPVAVENAKREIITRIRGRGPAPKHNAASYFGRMRHAKNLIKKLLKGGPDSWRPPIVGLDMLLAQYKTNSVLDSLVRNRDKVWIPPRKRKKFGEIKISHFSFLDNPIETMEALAQIAANDATMAGYQIHFDLEKCEDVSPFIVLGLMRDGMTPAAGGGRIAKSAGRMIEAVGLNWFLRMRVFVGAANQPDIWPLPLQTKAPGQSDAQSQAFAAQRKEKVTDSFVEAIDEWLYEAGDNEVRYELTKGGKATISAIFAELLDNAERHTIKGDDRGGGWRVAGFMAKRTVGSAEQYICNISIVSLGCTVGESLKDAQDPQVAAKLDQYCARHRKSFGNDEEADALLRTVCALQDRVSRVAQSGSNPHGGVGIMDMIDVVNALGQGPAGAVQPQVTIYSGNSCVMVREPYARGSKSGTGHNPPRTLWFNAANSLDNPPATSHVFKGKLRFPGTIVTARFSIDEKYLSSVGVSANA
jgi:hypothetical protein